MEIKSHDMPGAFLASHSLFTREELAAVLRGRGRADATVDSHLARWRRQGRIVRVKRGVFVRDDERAAANRPSPDFVALASRMAPDATVAYHTALEAHGYAQSVFERLTFVTWTKAKPTSFQGRRFVPVRPRAPLLAADRGERWVERADRAGIEIRVTTLERTVADVLDRPDLAGGIDEVWRSLLSVPALDLGALEEYATLLGNGTLVAKVGFFLEARRDELVVPAALLERLRDRVPGAPVFMERRRGGRLVPGWALIVAADLAQESAGSGTSSTRTDRSPSRAMLRHTKLESNGRWRAARRPEDRVHSRLRTLMSEIRAGLERLYGPRLKGVYLFGSCARGDETEESDVDVLVVLDDFQDYGEEVDRASFLTAELSLAHDVSINEVFVRQRDWLEAGTPFLRNVREEAVSA